VDEIRAVFVMVAGAFVPYVAFNVSVTCWPGTSELTVQVYVLPTKSHKARLAGLAEIELNVTPTGEVSVKTMLEMVSGRVLLMVMV